MPTLGVTEEDARDSVAFSTLEVTVSEFADVSGIAPPGQEGCREATGWWFKEIFW